MNPVKKARISWIKTRAAFRFHRFSSKLLQIRAAEFLVRRFATIRHGGTLRWPRNVTVRITERCFLRCRMCGQNGDRGRLRGVKASQRPVFDSRVLERIIAEIGRWPIKPFLKITGGEPFVERELTLATLKQAYSLGLVTKLNTNGILLADEKIARRVAASGLAYLSVSIDGPPDVHDQIRGRAGAYRAALQGIRNVQRYRLEVAKKPIMILVSAIVSTLNQDRILDLACLMDEAKVDWLNFEFMNFTTPSLSASAHKVVSDLFGVSETPWASFSNPELAAVNPEILAGQIEEVQRSRFSIPISFLDVGDLSAQNIADYFLRPETLLRRGICTIPYTTAFLVPPRQMVYCVDYPFEVCADLAESSLAAAWRSGRADSFRRKLAGYYREEKTNFPQCQRCNWRFN